MSPSLKGRGLTKILGNFGKKLKPILKTFAQNLTPLAKEKIKTIGSNLIKTGGQILSSRGAGEKRKRKRGRGPSKEDAEEEEEEEEAEETNSIKAFPHKNYLIPSHPVKLNTLKKTKRKKNNQKKT